MKFIDYFNFYQLDSYYQYDQIFIKFDQLLIYYLFNQHYCQFDFEFHYFIMIVLNLNFISKMMIILILIRFIVD
jgi:hypothetical protein